MDCSETNKIKYLNDLSHTKLNYRFKIFLHLDLLNKTFITRYHVENYFRLEHRAKSQAMKNKARTLTLITSAQSWNCSGVIIS